MSEFKQMTVDLESSKRTIDTVIRVGLIILLVYWCLLIFKPFLVPVLWAIIIAVAIYPLYLKLESLLGSRKKLSLVVFTLIALAILIIPTILLASSLVDMVQTVTTKLEDGTLKIPPPEDKVAEWPLIGGKTHAIWSAAATNLEGTIAKYAPQLKALGKWLLSAVAGAGAGVLQFIISILIAAALIATADSSDRFTRALAVRLAGEEGKDFAELAGATMRSVAQGVLGVAGIQAILAGVGMLAVGVPGAGLWAFLVLLLAVIQLPPLIILGPVMVYVFSAADTVPAVLFAIWAILVSLSDAFLKPLLLGRGLDIPMLVILVGALGGMITFGIIGLFVGAVVLAFGYRLFIAWLADDFRADPKALEKELIEQENQEKSGATV